MMFIHCAACARESLSSGNETQQKLAAFIDEENHVHFRCDAHCPPMHIATFELADPPTRIECSICSEAPT